MDFCLRTFNIRTYLVEKALMIFCKCLELYSQVYNYAICSDVFYLYGLPTVINQKKVLKVAENFEVELVPRQKHIYILAEFM